MNEKVAELFAAALQLSGEEQLQLIAALVSAADEQGLRPFGDDWLDEIQRRSAAYDAGHVQGIPWSEVKRKARQRSKELSGE